MECEGVCGVAANQDPEVVAVASQTLRLAASSALAAGVIGQGELEDAIGLMRARKAGQVTPTVFGAMGRRQE